MGAEAVDGTDEQCTQMPTRRAILAELTPVELQTNLDFCGLSVDDRRVRTQLVDALSRSRTARVDEMLLLEEEAEKLVADGVPEDVAWTDPDEHQFFVPDRARWDAIQKRATNIGETLNKACAALEEQNSALEGVLAGIDYNDERKLGDARNRDTVLARLVQHFSQVSLRNDRMAEPDLLGRTYEYLIEQFADDAGKKGGELEGKAKGRLDERPEVEVNQDRGVRFENSHDAQAPARAASSLGGSSIRRLSSWTECPSNSAPLASEIAPSARARKHKRLKRMGCSPGTARGSL